MRIKRFVLLLAFLNCLHHIPGGTIDYWHDYHSAEEDNLIQSGGHDTSNLRGKHKEFAGQECLGRQLATAFGGSRRLKSNNIIGLEKAQYGNGGIGFNNLDDQTDSLSSNRFNAQRVPRLSDELRSLRESRLKGRSNPIAETNAFLASLPPHRIHRKRSLRKPRLRQSYSFSALHPLDETDSIFESKPSSKSYLFQESNPSEGSDAFLAKDSSCKTHPFLESILGGTSLPFQRSSLSHGLSSLRHSKSPSGSLSYPDSSSLLDGLRPVRESSPSSGSVAFHNISPRSQTPRFVGLSSHLYHDSTLSNGLSSLRGSSILGGPYFDFQSYPSTKSYTSLSSKLSDDCNRLRSLHESSAQSGSTSYGETSPLSTTFSLLDSSPSSECLLHHIPTQSDNLCEVHPSIGAKTYPYGSYHESTPSSGINFQSLSVPDVLHSQRELRRPSGSNSYIYSKPLRTSNSYLDSGPLSRSHSFQEASLSDGLCKFHPSLPTSGSYAYHASSLSDGERSLRQSIPSSRFGSYVKPCAWNKKRSLREPKTLSSRQLSNPLTKISEPSKIYESNPMQQINSYEDAYNNPIVEFNVKNNEGGKTLTPCSKEDILTPPAVVHNQNTCGNDYIYKDLIEALHKKIDRIEKSLSQLTNDNASEQPESKKYQQNGGHLGGESDNFITKIFRKITNTQSPSSKLDNEQLPTKSSGVLNYGDSEPSKNYNSDEYISAKDQDKINDHYGTTEIYKKIAEAEKLLTDPRSSRTHPYKKVDKNPNYYRNVIAEIDSKIAEAERPLSQFIAEDNRNLLQDTNSYQNDDDGNEIAEIRKKIVKTGKPLAKFSTENKLESAELASNHNSSHYLDNNKGNFRRAITEIDSIIAEAEKPLSYFIAEDSLKSSNQNAENNGNEYSNEMAEINGKIDKAGEPLEQLNAKTTSESEGLVANQMPLESVETIKKDFRNVIAEIDSLISYAERPLPQQKAEDQQMTTSKFIDNQNPLHNTESYGNGYRNEMPAIHKDIDKAAEPLAHFNIESGPQADDLVANQKSEDNKAATADLNNEIVAAEKPLSQYIPEDSLRSSKLNDNRNIMQGIESYGNDVDEIERKINQAESQLTEVPLKSSKGLASDIDDFHSLFDEVNSQIADAEKSLDKYSTMATLAPSKLVSNLKHVHGINDYSGEIADIHKKIVETEKWLAQCKAEDNLENSVGTSNCVDDKKDVYCTLIAELHKKIAESEMALRRCSVGDSTETLELGNSQKYLDRVDSNGNNYHNAIAEIDSLVAETKKPISQDNVEDIQEPSGLVNNLQDIENLRSRRTLKMRRYQNADKIKANICPGEKQQQRTGDSKCGPNSSIAEQDIAERVKGLLSSMRNHTTEMMKSMCDLEADFLATDSANGINKNTSNIANSPRISANAIYPRSTVSNSDWYAKDDDGGGPELKSIKAYLARSVNEPLDEAHYNGDTMLAIPMPSPMMMTEPKAFDARIVPPTPTVGSKNDVPSDKLYQLWQKQLNNCKKIFNLALNNNNNNNNEPVNRPNYSSMQTYHK